MHELLMSQGYVNGIVANFTSNSRLYRFFVATKNSIVSSLVPSHPSDLIWIILASNKLLLRRPSSMPSHEGN